MQKGNASACGKPKRYRVKTRDELEAEGWALDAWGDLSHPEATLDIVRIMFPLLGRESDAVGTSSLGNIKLDIGYCWPPSVLVEITDNSDLDYSARGYELDALYKDPYQHGTRRCNHRNSDGSESWVNYTPYVNESPMAKFYCRHCEKEKCDD